MKKNKCYICKSEKFTVKENIKSKPAAETNFNIPENIYFRNISKCKICSVYNNFHELDLSNLYNEVYNESTYSNDIKDKFDFIMSLPDKKSDNKLRVERIVKHLKRDISDITNLSVLDVGSGLCVFLGELKKYGLKNLNCIDPSKISVSHSLENVKINSAYQGDFFDFDSKNKYDLITFNKVLEHVQNPIKMLSKAKEHLNRDGLVYLELPDGKSASQSGGFVDREEFFLEHFTVFNKESTNCLINMSGFKVIEIGEIHEPSDKYTIFSFIKIN